MQNVAREMNLSETAFCHARLDGFNLRWFTPSLEVDLCGHATLASAHILWEEGLLRRNTVGRFYTKSGILTAEFKENWIELNFPIDETTGAVSMSEASIIERALRVKPVYLARTRFDYLAEVGSEETVLEITPDMKLLRSLAGRGIAVTSRSTSSNYDFVSRFFAPKIGIDEDPVTGSSHCALTPFWGKKLNKKELIAFQASPRGGFLRVRASGDRVILGGQAVTVFKGELK